MKNSVLSFWGRNKAKRSRSAITLAKDSDFIIALTHLSAREAIARVQAVAEIDLLLGGHKHQNLQLWRGGFTPILKAEANARSVYVVDIHFDLRSRKAGCSAIGRGQCTAAE